MIFFDTIDAHGPQEGVIGIQLFEVGVPNSSMAFDLRIKDFFNRNWCVPLFRENGVENSAAFFYSHGDDSDAIRFFRLSLARLSLAWLFALGRVLT
jgi:hypothetical protein